MPIVINCQCGKQLRVPDELAGKKIRCPVCGEPRRVPVIDPDGLPAIRFRCQECGKAMQTKQELAGRKIHCPICQAVVAIPQPEEAVTAEGHRERLRSGKAMASRAAARSRLEEEDDADQFEEDEEEDQPRKTRKGKKSLGMILGLTACGVVLVAGVSALVLYLMAGGGSSPTVPDRQVPGKVGSNLPRGGIPAVPAGNDSVSLANLKEIGPAIQKYMTTHKGQAPGNIVDRGGKPLLSWRVELLPSLGEEELYQKFKRDEPWNSPSNKALIPLMPKVYAFPNQSGVGLTHYKMYIGPKTLYEKGPPSRNSMMVKNPPNLLAVVEAAQPVEWTNPATELLFSNGECHVVMWDGSPRTLKETIDPQNLKNAILANEGGRFNP